MCSNNNNNNLGKLDKLVKRAGSGEEQMTREVQQVSTFLSVKYGAVMV